MIINLLNNNKNNNNNNKYLLYKINDYLESETLINEDDHQKQINEINNTNGK